MRLASAPKDKKYVSHKANPQLPAVYQQVYLDDRSYETNCTLLKSISMAIGLSALQGKARRTVTLVLSA